MSKRSTSSPTPKAKGKRSWKMMGTAVGVAAGLAATQALNALWKTATGRQPPNAPESPEIGNREALVWAALSGMALGVAKMYATRRAATYWMRSFGTLPPGMEKGATKETRRKITP